jgi:divalent metal cation (Fe/Co/Zn/Cd) transporter
MPPADRAATSLAEHNMTITGELAAAAARHHIEPSPSAVAPACHNRSDWLIVVSAMVVILSIMLGAAMVLPLDPSASQPVDIVGP